MDHAIKGAKKIGAKRLEIGTIAEYTELARWYSRLDFQMKNTKKFIHLPFTVAFMYLTIE